MFNTKKKLRERIAELEKRLDEMDTALQASKDVLKAKELAYDQHLESLIREKNDWFTKYTALRNVSKRDQEELEKKTKRIKALQKIVDSHKQSKREIKDKDTDPFIEE